MEKIRIAIADDHTLVRQTIATALAHDRKLEIVLQAENGRMLVDQIEQSKPDVVILDIEMPVMDGFEVLDHLNFHYQHAKVIVLSMHFDNLVMKDLIQRGAHGFLPKNSDFESLLNAIHEVMQNGYFFSKKINSRLVEELLHQYTERPSLSGQPLNSKELQVLNLICRDKLIGEIAEIMSVSERTVERYRASLLEKTQTKTGAGLVLYAIRNHLFSPQKKG